MIDRTLSKIVRDIKMLQKKVARLSALEKMNIAAVHSSIIPGTDSAHDLGSVTHKWANVYSDSIAGVMTGAEWEFSGTSMKIDAYHVGQHTTVYVRNDDGTYEADLDVERNIVVGGTVDGVDIAARDGDLSTAEGDLSTLDGAVLKKDGSVALTSDWDAGSHKITAEQFESDVATSTPPFIVASETVVDNLNADLLDGIEAAEFLQRDGSIPLTSDWDAGSHKITAEQLESDIGIGTAPLIVVSTTMVDNLNADMLDNYDAAAFPRKAEAATITAAWTFSTAISGDLPLDGDLDFTGAQAITTTAGNLTLAPAGDIVLNPTGNDVLPGSHRDINLGEIATWFDTGYIDQLQVGTIKSVVFETQEVHVFNGSFMVAKSSASLAVAKTFAASGADTFIANDTGKFTVGDFLRLKDSDSDTWLEVTGIGSDPTINVTVEDGGSESFVAGNTIVNYGASGQGMLLLTADDLGTVAGPAISVFDHAGVPWTTQTEYVRLGNLNGWGGFAADKWGIGLGEYAANVPNFYVNATDGVLKMRIYDADYLVLDYNGGDPTAQIVGSLEVTSPGEITAGDGIVILDTDGITIEQGSTYHFNLVDGATWLGGIRFWENDGLNTSWFTFTNEGLQGDKKFYFNGASVKTTHSLIAASDVIATGGVLSGHSGVLQVDAGDVKYSGSLQSYKNTTAYEVYGFHPLTTPLTDTAWDGDSRSTTAKTKIVLHDIFGVPEGVKAVLAYVAMKDSGSEAAATYFILSPVNSVNVGPLLVVPDGAANDRWTYASEIVPCDASGDIYFQVIASGSSTMDVYLQIWGYWI